MLDPLVSNYDVLSIYEPLRTGTHDDASFDHTLSFCIAAQSINITVLNDKIRAVFDSQYFHRNPPAWGSPGRPFLQMALLHPFQAKLSSVIHELPLADQAAEVNFMYSRAYKGLSMLVMQMLDAISRTANGNPLYEADLQLPTIEGIQFPSLLDNTAPFPIAKHSGPIRTAHLTKMTTKAFLEDGEWIGCQTSELRRSPMPFKQPIGNMYLEADEPDPLSPTISIHASNCKDDSGVYRLSGTIDLSTGVMLATQFYEIEHRPMYSNRQRYWVALLTPFGIVGSWDISKDGPMSNWSGWFWLWKKSWATPSREPSPLYRLPSDIQAIREAEAAANAAERQEFFQRINIGGPGVHIFR